jgi:hypothetical protein
MNTAKELYDVAFLNQVTGPIKAVTEAYDQRELSTGLHTYERADKISDDLAYDLGRVVLTCTSIRAVVDTKDVLQSIQSGSMDEMSAMISLTRISDRESLRIK